jgi:hypothetical protein
LLTVTPTGVLILPPGIGGRATSNLTSSKREWSLIFRARLFVVSCRNGCQASQNQVQSRCRRGVADLGERDVVGASDKEHRSPEIERTIRLGESLVLRGKLTREQLQAALEIKENDPQRLGEILLSQKLVSGEDLAQAVAEATGFEYVSLTEGSVDPAAVSILSEKVLRKHMALPLRIENG